MSSSLTLLAGSSAITPLAVSQRPSIAFFNSAWPSSNTLLAASPTSSSVRMAGKRPGQIPSLEKRSPIDILRNGGEVIILENTAADEFRLDRRMGSGEFDPCLVV